MNRPCRLPRLLLSLGRCNLGSMLIRPALGSALVLAACSVFPDRAPIIELGPTEGGAGSSGGSGANAGGTAGMGGMAGMGGGAASGGTGGVGTGGADGGGGDARADASSDARVADASPDGRDGAKDAGGRLATYPATIADCLEQGELDPNACRSFAESQSGPDQMWVDVRHPPRSEFRGFLKFDVDDAILGATVSAVRLEVSVASNGDAAASAPAVWQVEEFQTRAELFLTEPMPVGSAALADAPQAIDGSTLTYALPIDSVSPGASLYLGLLPESAAGVALWNANGSRPPQLVIEYR